jgi:hypothetical protein
MNTPKTNVPLTAHNSFANQLDFVIRSILSGVWTAAVVRVEAVEAPHYVDILPLVNQIDNAGNPVDMAVIYNVPYFTLQGGLNAVRITPQKGDVGIAVFAMRDISAVKAAKAPSSPATLRQYSPADAIYIGGILNTEAARYIEITDEAITVKGTGQVVIDAEGEITIQGAKGLTITAETDITGDVAVTGDITVQGNIGTTGDITATGNVTAAAITASGNITAAGISTNGNIAAAGIAATGDIVAGTVSLKNHTHNYVDSSPATPVTQPTTPPLV